jgi:hypothetical protein
MHIPGIALLRYIRHNNCIEFDMSDKEWLSKLESVRITKFTITDSVHLVCRVSFVFTNMLSVSPPSASLLKDCPQFESLVKRLTLLFLDEDGAVKSELVSSSSVQVICALRGLTS